MYLGRRRAAFAFAIPALVLVPLLAWQARDGMDVFFATTLTRGDYVLLCMTTAKDGRSHLEHGMIQRMSVQ